MSKVQIVRLEHNSTRWQFVAHGAAYTKEEAEAVKLNAEARGDKVRFLPVRNES